MTDVSVVLESSSRNVVGLNMRNVMKVSDVIAELKQCPGECEVGVDSTGWLEDHYAQSVEYDSETNKVWIHSTLERECDEKN